MMWLSYYKPLSLQNMALNRLAANLFTKSNILLSISKAHIQFPPSESHDSLQVWQATVEVKLQDEISKLWLPTSLSNRFIDVVKLMGNQVRNWKEFHEKYLPMEKVLNGEEVHFGAPVLEKLCLTSDGSVDYRKTAEELIRSDLVDIVKKYKLASLYCLEDKIPIFWKELPKDYQKYFGSKKGYFLYNRGFGQEFWWPYIIKGQESKLDKLTLLKSTDQITFHQYAFQCSVYKGNKTAASYYLQKLTREEKQASLMNETKSLIEYVYTFRYTKRNHREKTFPLEKVSELLRYLLSVMTPDQQIRLFQENPLEILEWFMVWPLQDMFLEIADTIWHCVPDEDRDGVLRVMYDGLRRPDLSCQKLLQEFFLRIPSDFWIGFVDRQCESGSYFRYVLFHRDMKALEIFFRNLNDEARKKLVFSELVLKFLHDCLSKGELGVLELFLCEARLSHEDKKRLKEDFMIHLTSIKVNMKLKTRKWSRFFDLLDEANGVSKRCSEDKTPTACKKQRLYYKE